MQYTETHVLALEKEALRNLQEKVIYSNMRTIIDSVQTKSLKVRGWTIEAHNCVDTYDGSRPWKQRNAPADDEAEYIYTMFLTVTFAHESKKPGTFELASILRTIYARGSSAAMGRWVLVSVDDDEYKPPTDGSDIPSSDEMVGYAEVTGIPEDWDDYFSHLFGLDPHIARVHAALEAGIASNFRNRFHVALVGPPGCGKSDICASVKRALGEDAVMEFDATATTAAGAIKELAERDLLPRVMIVEEIEKADPKALGFLLALCDLRGEIRKTTARATIQRDTKMLVIATVNDYQLFCSLQANALASRFSNPVWFRRPSRETLALILSREILKVDGDLAWIEPTLDYCESMNITDPRNVLAICLCGREMLLTGEYQSMLAETANPADDV